MYFPSGDKLALSRARRLRQPRRLITFTLPLSVETQASCSVWSVPFRISTSSDLPSLENASQSYHASLALLSSALEGAPGLASITRNSGFQSLTTPES